MRIIKRGADPAAQPIRWTCGYCQTVMEFTAKELLVEPPPQDHGATGRYVVCPHCARRVYDDAAQRDSR